MAPRERRLASNEALFREVNENVRALAAAHDAGDDFYEYICECADVGCTARVPLTQPEYEFARADGTRFILVPGHQHAEVERVLQKTERYVLVEKFGHGGAQAEALDPRS